MTSTTSRKLMLRACPRCQGDLLYDTHEEDFACLQCGRHTSASAVVATLQQSATADARPQAAAVAA